MKLTKNVCRPLRRISRLRLLQAAAIGASLAIGLSVRADSFPTPAIPDFCCVQLKSNNHNAANLDKVKMIGFAFVRRGFIWEQIEKTPGQYDFSDYDKLLDDCKSRGLGVYATLASPKSTQDGTVLTDSGRAAFAKFATAVASHYKGQRIIYEIWNEPNNASSWGKHGKANCAPFAQEYTTLVKAVVPAMHAADPDCLVVAGSVSGLYAPSYDWMQNCFTNGILSSGINGWSVHPYTLKCPEDYIDAYARVRKMLSDAGAPGDFPLLDSERGYPLNKAEGYAGGDPELSKQYQAWHFVRQTLVDLLSGVRLSNWYEWSGKEGFSLHDPAGATPASTAAKTMFKQLDGSTFVKRIDLHDARDFALLFKNSTGGETIVAWTSPPPGQTADKAKPHQIDLPLSAQGAIDVVDLLGQPSKIQATDGVAHVSISGAPQYIVLSPQH